MSTKTRAGVHRDRYAGMSGKRSMKPPSTRSQDDLGLDPRRVRRHAARAASVYDSAAWLPRQVADALLEHLQPVRMRPRRILDLGAGTGICSRELQRHYRDARVFCVDFSLPMLRAGRRTGLGWRSKRALACGDAVHLPIADASIDLVVSSLMLQSCPTPHAVLAECARVLEPAGLLMFASLGPGTLRELRDSWSQVDTHVHVHPFVDMHDIGDALVRAGLRDVVMDVERINVEYADLDSLMRELKRLGASNASRGSAAGLTSRARMAALAAAYERYRGGAALPVTYEVVFGHAWRAPAARIEIAAPAPPHPRRTT